MLNSLIRKSSHSIGQGASRLVVNHSFGEDILIDGVKWILRQMPRTVWVRIGPLDTRTSLLGMIMSNLSQGLVGRMKELRNCPMESFFPRFHSIVLKVIS